MQYVIFTVKVNQKEKNAFLPLDEFISYIDDETLDRYMKANSIDSRYTALTSFRKNIKAFNSYAPQGRLNECTLTVTRKASALCKVGEAPTNRSVSECRLDFAEYALNNYDNPFPILEKISRNLTLNGFISNKYLMAQEEVASTRKMLHAIIDEFTEDVISENSRLWAEEYKKR